VAMASPLNPDQDPMVKFVLIEPEEFDHQDATPEVEDRPPEQWGYWYITAYSVQRAYGGPEEGGWYYDVYSVIETREAGTYEEAQEVKTMMEMDFGLRERAEGVGGRDAPGEAIEQGHTTLVRPNAELTDDYEPVSQTDDESYVYDSGEVTIVIEREAGEHTTQGRPRYE
jgi:hypothetical protein